MSPIINNSSPAIDMEYGQEMQQMPRLLPPTIDTRSSEGCEVVVMSEANQSRRSNEGRGNVGRMLREGCAPIANRECMGNVRNKACTVVGALIWIGALIGIGYAIAGAVKFSKQCPNGLDSSPGCVPCDENRTNDCVDGSPPNYGPV